MAQFLKSNFRGLLIPDTRITESAIDAAASTFTQADPQVGIPVPEGQTDLNLEATGTQSASGHLNIATQRGGHPGGGMSFRWKNESDSSSSWRGSWPFSAMSGNKVIRAINPTTTNGRREAINAHGVLMDDGKIGVVYDEVHYTLGTTYYRLAFFTVSADGTVSSDSILYTRLTGTQRLHPCLVKMPDGRLMIFHYLEDQNEKTVQVQALTSTNNGSSWSIANSACLDQEIGVDSSSTSDYDLNDNPAAKMRVAYSGGQMLMLISMRSNDTSTGNFENGFFQYASSDQGLTFERVEVWDRTINGTQGEIVPSVNGFEVFFCQYATSGSPNQFVRRRSLASAFIPLSSATDLDGPNVLQTGNFDPCFGSGRSFTDAELSACIADDGQLYVIARGKLTSGGFASSACGDLRICVDPSGGATRDQNYELMGQGTSGDEAGTVGDRGGTIYFAEGTTDFPRFFGMIPGHGRIYLFHNSSAGTSNRDNCLWLAPLGGYQTATLGTTDEFGTPKYQVCWDRTYLPIELPNNFNGWNLGTAGTSSADVDSGYLNLSTTSGRITYDKTPTGTIAEGIIANFGVQHVSQTGPTSDLVFSRFTLADGSDKYTLDVYVRNGVIDVQDNNGGTLLGTLAIDTQTNGVDVLVFFRSGKATVYARQLTLASDNAWTAVCSNATVSDSGTGSMEVRFGHTAGSTAASKWYFFNYVSDQWAGGTPYSTGFTNPDDLIGKRLSSTNQTYVSDGVSIRGIDGPSLPGQSWDISARYGFSIANILPANEPSPAKGWRSTDETQNSIVWNFEGANSYRTLGIYLDGCNWKTGKIQGYNAATSSYDDLASIDFSTGQTNLAFNRIGNTVNVNTGLTTAAGRYFEFNEFEGGTVDLGSSKYRTITGNSAGVWTNTANNQLPGIQFSGLDNTEPGTGRLDIWSPRILIVVHDIANVYTKFKLIIDAQQTATDDLRIGQMIVGPCHLFTHDYSWGRSISNEANSELITYRDGTRTSFKRGKNRKAVSFGWGEGVDIGPIQGSAPSADYVVSTSSAGARPIGYRGDTVSVLNQLHSFVAGPNLPVVYIASVDSGSTGNDVKTIQGIGAALYGRIVTGITVDSIVGDELDSESGEVMRIAQMTIEEEI